MPDSHARTNMITPEQIQALKRKQDTLQSLYRACMAEKRKYTSVYVGDEYGNIVELQPDGTEKIVGYAKHPF
ncbi:hypothetical protein HMPREF9120_01750 [Neisseria sp. oral taxon 020 str. F0370]|uniref:hypothetical protein n=1 Tax=unclassified Neisseria TaxID=2623750 RepID=UPI0002A35AB0|nr:MULTISPECIES: hypothetical protein [unclassified Neisseria]ASP18191.1 hypothetical protein CGZ77_10880 [Neisseria sp. KEM232]EKY05654.1 hypothetical protein HMPREF9120_01750 [Neisseria sp. oral taxon 020 str. F0370]